MPKLEGHSSHECMKRNDDEFVIEQNVLQAGPHLVEVQSDAVIHFLMRVEVY